MLKYCDFSPIDNSTRFYEFSQLNLQKNISSTYSLYMTEYGEQIHLIKLNSINQVKILDDFVAAGIIRTILGFARFQKNYYCFASVKDVYSLDELIKNKKEDRSFFDEIFCTSLIQGVLDIQKIFQKAGLVVKFLNPKEISITQLIKTRNQVKLGLIFPLSFNIFQKCTPQEVSRNENFCSPQQLKYEKNEEQLRLRDFKKSFLFSLGMILLYCFGHQIDRQQRLKSLQNARQLILFIKGVRKQIKTLHQGKFISKAMKILLQNSEAMRDNAQVFKLKLYSKQFQSLKKIIPIEQQHQNNLSTKFITQSQSKQSASEKFTIDIRISKYSGSFSKYSKQNDSMSRQKTETFIDSQMELNINNYTSSLKNMKRSNKSISQLNNSQNFDKSNQKDSLHSTHANFSMGKSKLNQSIRRGPLKTEQSQCADQPMQSPVDINFDEMNDSNNLDQSRKSYQAFQEQQQSQKLEQLQKSNKSIAGSAGKIPHLKQPIIQEKQAHQQQDNDIIIVQDQQQYHQKIQQFQMKDMHRNADEMMREQSFNEIERIQRHLIQELQYPKPKSHQRRQYVQNRQDDILRISFQSKSKLLFSVIVLIYLVYGITDFYIN